MVLIALLVAGGEALKNFSLALAAGVLVGSYSSIFIVVRVLIMTGLSKKDMEKPKNEPEESYTLDWYPAITHFDKSLKHLGVATIIWSESYVSGLPSKSAIKHPEDWAINSAANLSQGFNPCPQNPSNLPAAQ